MFGKGKKRALSGDMSPTGGTAAAAGHMLERKQRSHTTGKKRVRTLGVDERLEEQRLEKLVFGDASDVVANLDSDNDLLDLEFDDPEEGSSGSISTSNATQTTATAAAGASEDDSGVDEGDKSPVVDGKQDCQREPVWMDEDDDNIQVKDALQSQGRNLPALAESRQGYSGFLKRKYEAVVGTPRWAELGATASRKTDSDSDDEEIMQHSGPFLSRSGAHSLNKGMLEIKHLKDLNADSCAEGPIIAATEFHPTSTVALVAGLNGAVSLVQVDGRTNTKLQTIQFERFPVRCAHFSQDGSQFIVGSQHHGHFFVYDMMEGRTIKVPISHNSDITNMKKFSVSPDGRLLAVPGRFGHIHLVTAQSKEWLGSLKMNGEVKAIVFNKDGSRLYSHGEGGEVYVWDMNSRSCIHRFVDDGCIEGTTLALSPNEQYLACGSSSGVVNVYNSSSILTTSAPRPLKVALNLVTPITSLLYNASSEILAMASVEKENAIRLMHLPSLTVFSNFPHVSENIFRPQCVDFTPHSGYFAVGNNRGRALLYRLKHFGNY